ncbi:MAG TPA: tyrosine-type recombinase/integrase [Thermotogota bacterium]|nr:tyrosine-type recombinase/integrase [Thermotogota bacterium]
MRRFYLHRRGKIWYAELVDTATGIKLPAKSTRQTIRDEAAIVVNNWLLHGLPVRGESSPKKISDTFDLATILTIIKKTNLNTLDVSKIGTALTEKGLVSSVVLKDTGGAELFETFLSRFWEYEVSPYVKEKHAHGLRMGKTHMIQSLGRAVKYWIPYFKGKRLGEITRQDVKGFSVHLATENPGLNPVTLNRIMTVGTTALKWAFVNELINADPTQGLAAYSNKTKKRGVLTPDEAKRLFDLRWSDRRAMLANLTAMTTGLRIGEILALKASDIGELYLTITHSWSRKDGLKCTKTGEDRRVPIIPRVRDALRALVLENPHGSDGFVFWSSKKEEPWDQQMSLYALQDMLVVLSVGEKATEDEKREARAYWKERNVVFHSWRHFYASRMADRLEARKVMLVTGHKTRAVFDGYADHSLDSDLNEVALASVETFDSILPLRFVG